MKKTMAVVLALTMALLSSCQAKEEANPANPAPESPAAPAKEAHLEGETLPDPQTFSQQQTMDFELLEKTFYGQWTGEDGDFLLTYQKDSLALDNMRILGLSQDESNWYMELFAGGVGQLFIINKAEPDVLYCYDDWGAQQPAMTDYSYRFRRDKSADSSTEIAPGPISVSGMQKLKTLLGTELWNIGTEVTLADGTSWVALSALCLPGEEISLVEAPTESRVVLTRGLYPAGSEPEKLDESGNTARTLITITAEKQGEQWVVTQAQPAA